MAQLMTMQVTEPGLFVEGRTQSWRALLELSQDLPIVGEFGELDALLLVVSEQPSGVVDLLRVVQPRDLQLSDTGSPRRTDHADLYFHSPITAQECLEALLVDFQQLLNAHLNTRVVVTEGREDLAPLEPQSGAHPPLDPDDQTVVLEYRGERLVVLRIVEQEVEDPGYWQTRLEVIENTMGSTALFLLNDPLDTFMAVASPALEDGSPVLPQTNDEGEGRVPAIRFRHLAMTDAQQAASGVLNDLLEYLRSKTVFRDNLTDRRTFTFWSEA